MKTLIAIAIAAIVFFKTNLFIGFSLLVYPGMTSLLLELT